MLITYLINTSDLIFATDSMLYNKKARNRVALYIFTGFIDDGILKIDRK
jgi:hypothetical protein